MGTQINPDTIAYPIPVIEKEADEAKWTKGSCIAEMGTHWAYDLKSAPVMSWVGGNMIPVVAMYNSGIISAMFFASTVVQQGIGNHQWDLLPLPDFLMCKNFCKFSRFRFRFRFRVFASAR